jgi:hypothetical protein
MTRSTSMKADTTITLDPNQVRAWEGEAHELESRAQAMMEQAKALRRKAEAAAFLLGIDNNPNPQQLKPGPVTPAPARPEPTAETTTMISAIADIANTSDKPVTKAAMKARLLALGFPKDRLGNYFYICVARLKRKHRISVLPNGNIWKLDA